MPVLFYIVLEFSSLSLLGWVFMRRMRIVKKTKEMQKELEDQQKKVDRVMKKEKRERERALMELQRSSEVKQQALRNLGASGELMKKALQEIGIQDFESAQKTLIQVISLDEHHRKANELLAEIYLQQEQYKKAEIIYKKLIGLYAFDPNYPSQLAKTYFQQRQYKTATEHYEKALQMDKGNPQRSLNLGHVYLARKQYGPALEYYEKAHRLSVRDIELMFLIVDTFLHNSNPISAREYLQKILDYEPYNQRAKTMLSDVLRMLKEEPA